MSDNPERHEIVHKQADALRRDLQERTGLCLHLVVTDNVSSMLSYKRVAPQRGLLRLHRMFLDADGTIRAALADWLTGDRRGPSGEALDTFIRDNCHQIRRKGRRRIVVRTEGFVYNLQELFDELNAEFFGGGVQTPITWGRNAPFGTVRRSIRFGSYSSRDDIIRIHPVLDQEFVPRYFVRYIVFHEMLHAWVGIGRTANGRRQIHTPEFNRIEQAYPDYGRALAWQREPGNLNRLLRG